MKFLRTLLVCAAMASAFVASARASEVPSCQSQSPCNPSGFAIHRGTNLSHYLSQDFGWQKREVWLTENDIRFIARQGFDHVRLPVDEKELWNEDGTRNEGAFKQLLEVISWARKSGLRVIVDMHVLRSHHFNASNEGGSNTLWTDPKAQAHLGELWRDLSGVLKDIPNSELAYEIMNEPVADEAEQWNALVAMTMKTIRSLEPGRVVVIGANLWQIPEMLPLLKVPEGDRNIILSFHTYSPMLFTHYAAEWTGLRSYKGPINYPGVVATQADVAELMKSDDASVRLFAAQATEDWNPARLLKVYEPAIARAKELGLQLYCGEFGSMPTVPRTARLAYYRDIVGVFEANGIAWANWEYKGDFGIFQWNGAKDSIGAPDVEIIDALMQRDASCCNASACKK